MTPAMRIMHMTDEHHNSSLEWIGLSEWLEVLLCRNHNYYSTVEALIFEFFDHGEGSNYIIPFEKFLNLNRLSLDTMDWHPIFLLI